MTKKIPEAFELFFFLLPVFYHQGKLKPNKELLGVVCETLSLGFSLT